MSRFGTATAWLPLAILLVAAAVGPLRLPIMLALLVGFSLNLRRAWAEGRPPDATTSLYGACLLVAMVVAWSGVALPPDARDGSTCASLGAPFALYRLAGAALVVTGTALLLRLVRSTVAEIGVRPVSRAGFGLALGVLLAFGSISVFVGPRIAEAFFGPLPVALGNPLALVPALIFAIANAGMEETVYRGVLLRWVRRSRGVAVAMALQAIVFGLAHSVSSDFVGSPLPVMVATAAAGLMFGVLALRSGSLLQPIALHAALDLPIYYANACVLR